MAGVLILFNEFAGDRQARRTAHELTNLLGSSRGDCPVEDVQIPMTGDHDGWAAINALVARGWDLLVVIGGDGTLNDVVNGLDAAHLAVPIAFLGTGTINVFSQALGLPRRVDDVARLLADQAFETRDVPVAEIRTAGGAGTPHRWIQFCEAGFLADAMVRVNASSGSLLLAGRTFRRPRKKAFVAMKSFEAAIGNRGRNLWLDQPGGPYYSDIMLIRVREYGGLSVPIDDPDLTRADFTILGFRSEAFSGHMAFMLRLTLGRLAQPKVWQRLAAKGLLEYRPHVQRAVIGEVAPLDTSRFVDAETLDIAFPLECDFASGLVMRAVVPRRAG